MTIIEISNKILERIRSEINTYKPDKAFAFYLIEDLQTEIPSKRILWLIRSSTELTDNRRYLNTGNEFSKNSPFGNAIAEMNNEPGEEITYKVRDKEFRIAIHANSIYRVKENDYDAWQGKLNIKSNDTTIYFEKSLNELIKSYKEKVNSLQQSSKENQNVILSDNQLSSDLIKSILQDYELKEKNEFNKRTTGNTISEQFLLDSNQNKIKRAKVLSGPMVMNGGPGTGKTTTLIHRIQYILDPIIEEYAGLSKEQKDTLDQGINNWLFITPNDLFKFYLGKAMANEGLQVDHQNNVLTWDQCRDNLAIAFGIINHQKDNSQFITFKRAKKKLWNLKPTELLEIRNYFFKYIIKSISKTIIINDTDLNSCTTIFKAKVNGIQKTLAEFGINPDLLNFLNKIATINNDIANLKTEVEKNYSPSVDKLIEYLSSINPNLKTSEESKKDIYKNISKRIETKDYEQLKQLFPHKYNYIKDYEKFNILFKGFPIDPEHLLLNLIPRVYKKFRSEKLNDFLFLNPHTKNLISEIAGLSETKVKLYNDEQDLLIYFYLDCINTIRKYAPTVYSRSKHPIINYFKKNIKALVAVDEATEFSVTQLSCMYHLADSLFKHSITFSGDMMQQLDNRGYSKWEDLKIIMPGLEVMNLSKSYRQTPKLIELAKNLYANHYGQIPDLHPVNSDVINIPDPIYYIEKDFDKRIQWIEKRLEEVYNFYGENKPNIVIFVPQSLEEINENEPHLIENIETKIANAINKCQLLINRNISSKPIFDGKDLGDINQIRIMNFKLIKGMEFDCAFFMDIDEAKNIESNLLDKYIYLGISRARHFLAMTCVNKLPARLEPVRDLVVENGTWAKHIDIS